MKQLYRFLRQMRLNVDSVEQGTQKLNHVELIDLVTNLSVLLTEENTVQPTIFTFSASGSMSGGPFPCAGWECRLDKLDSLARFAALYAERVYVPNPFERYLFMDKLGNTQRRDIVGDIIGLWKSQALFDAGIFSIRNSVHVLYDDHMKAQFELEQFVESSLDLAVPVLQLQYADAVRVHVCRDGDELFMRLTGSPDLIEHEVLDLVGTLPQPLVDRLGNLDSVELTNDEILKYGCLAPVFAPIAEDVFQQNVNAKMRSISYLSGRKVEFDLATAILNPTQIAAESESLVEGLAHTLPNLIEIDIDKLVELRNREGEAFNVYRDAVRSVLKRANGLSIDEMKELVDDEIRPEIHKIDQTVHNSRRLLVQSLSTDLLVGTGYVMIGLYSGILSPQASEIVAAVGGISLVGRVTEKLLKLRNIRQEVHENPYYFLWHANKNR